MHPNERFRDQMDRPELRVFKRDYEVEIERALKQLWTGSMIRSK